MRSGAIGAVASQAVLSLELNVRSTQALVYGYAVPVLFLVGFGSVFRSESPALLGEMGQILTITILGGACFGLPTSLVAERQQGVWRRYRLLPVPTGALLAGVMAARVAIVVSAALIQVALARAAYGTPLPAHPWQEIAAVVLVTSSFMGLGLLIAAFASDVPAVQAVGQCIFLPMILVGGVGIPLAALPNWAQVASGFMPGRYAVDLLQRAYSAPEGLSRAGFSAVAVAAIGIAATAVALGLLTWETPRRLAPGAWGRLAPALGAWIVVGAAAAYSGRLVVTPGSIGDFEGISEAQIAAIGFDDLPGDSEFVSRLSAPLSGNEDARTRQLALDIAAWPEAKTGDSVQDARNLLSAAAIADVSRDQHEGEAARVIFDRLRATQSGPRLQKILARVILDPEGGTVVTSAPELGLEGTFTEKIVRQRVDLYARKLLGRLRGRIRD